MQVVKCKLPPARSLISFFTPPPPPKKTSIWKTSQGSKLHFRVPAGPPQKCNLHLGSPPQKKNTLRGWGSYMGAPFPVHSRWSNFCFCTSTTKTDVQKKTAPSHSSPLLCDEWLDILPKRSGPRSDDLLARETFRNKKMLDRHGCIYALATQDFCCHHLDDMIFLGWSPT